MSKMSSTSVLTVYYNFNVTFTDRAYDRCVRKLLVIAICEIPTFPKTRSTSSRSTNHPGHAHSFALRQ